MFTTSLPRLDNCRFHVENAEYVATYLINRSLRHGVRVYTALLSVHFITLQRMVESEASINRHRARSNLSVRVFVLSMKSAAVLKVVAVSSAKKTLSSVSNCFR